MLEPRYFSIASIVVGAELGLGSYRTAWIMREAAPCHGSTPHKERPGCCARPPQGSGGMLVAGAVEIDDGKLRRARLKVMEGFGEQELHAVVLGAVGPSDPAPESGTTRSHSARCADRRRSTSIFYRRRPMRS
jgi:hypothetical protein